MNADGSGQTNLTNNPAGDVNPGWSPDGTKIAFDSGRDGNQEIYIMKADGTELNRLTNNAVADGDGLGDPAEVVLATDLAAADTDGDTVSDVWELLESGSDPLVEDTDNDGCSDGAEIGSNPVEGGRRDPLSFWDFIDQWTGLPPARDGSIVSSDIGAGVARFGTTRGSQPTNDEALSEALTPPLDMTSYHASADRGPGLGPSGNPWNLLPPDGTITVGDIWAVVVQFGHTCA